MASGRTAVFHIIFFRPDHNFESRFGEKGVQAKMRSKKSRPRPFSILPFPALSRDNFFLLSGMSDPVCDVGFEQTRFPLSLSPSTSFLRICFPLFLSSFPPLFSCVISTLKIRKWRATINHSWKTVEKRGKNHPVRAVSNTD